MTNLKTHARLGTRHRTKTTTKKNNTTQKTKQMSNMDLTKNHNTEN